MPTRSTHPATRYRIGIAVFLAALIASTTALQAQEAQVDFTDFDCWKIRRSGALLELDRLTSEGPVPTAFQCFGRSCVNRTEIVAKDGSVSEVFRHIYFPRGRDEYVSSWAMWRAGSDQPAIHRSTVYQLIRCQPTADGS